MKRITTISKLLSVLVIPLLFVVAMGLDGCSRGDASASPTAASAKPSVEGNGEWITLPANSQGDSFFITAPIGHGTVQGTAQAPARIVASASRATAGEGGNIILFDTPEMTSLFSSFRQNMAALEKSRKNLARQKDLFAHQSSTGKDVSEAETDVLNAESVVAESEGKLRAVGFNPSEMQNAPSGTVWLMSDVPESQMHDLQRGGIASIELSSLPGKKYNGRIAAIGDVVDNTTRSVKVRISVSGAGELRPGMFATISYGAAQNAVAFVPQSSIITVLSKNYAFVKAGERKFQRKEVQIGHQVGDSVTITSGLDANDQVVTEGAILLKGLSFGY